MPAPAGPEGRVARRRVDHGSGPSAGRVDNFVYTTGRVGSGPEKSNPWSTLARRTDGAATV